MIIKMIPMRWIPTRFIIINTLFVLWPNCVFFTPTVPPYGYDAIVPSRRQRSLTDTDAACRRLKLVRIWETDGSVREREGERERATEREERSVYQEYGACMLCVWRSSTRRHQPEETEPNGSRNSVRQFVNSFQTRAHIAIKTHRLSSAPPIPFFFIFIFILSCRGLKPKTRVDIDSKISGRSVQRTEFDPAVWAHAVWKLH